MTDSMILSKSVFSKFKEYKMKNIDTSLPVNLPLLFRLRSQDCEDITVQASKDSTGTFKYYTFKEFYEQVILFALALKELGIKRGDHVALISDNRREWLITDVALLSLGAADVPRGCDSMGTEIRYIISYAECTYGFFENTRQLQKVLDNIQEVPLFKTAILFDGYSEDIALTAKEKGITLYSFQQLMEKGKTIGLEHRSEIESEMDKTKGDEVATLIFTSGTTGVPKGVMLTHRNYMAQLEVVHTVLHVKKGDMWLSVLPVWHSFERVVQYIAITLKSGIAYSKPIASVMLPDMAAIRPQWMCGVPRLWESLAQGVYRSMKKAGGIKYTLFNFFVTVGKKYIVAKEYVTGRIPRFSQRVRLFDFIAGIIPFLFLWPLYQLGNVLIYKKIKEKLGGRLECGISGGGALQPDTDLFYRGIGVRLLEGYGITEAGPVLSVRNSKKPRPGCVGVVYPCSEIKIVQEEQGTILNNQPLPAGKKGMILARGDQIMKGYYKQPELTASVIDKDGWLNTGDIGMLTLDNEIKITGRAKDTIVLLGGENIEPLGIESALTSSSYIETAVLMGQDKKYLGALIVPVKDMLQSFAKETGLTYTSYEELLESAEIANLIRSEIDNQVSSKTGFRTCELVSKFVLLPESFTVGKELSGKQELMRHKIAQMYKEEIGTLF
jgi:long-chain acyl-CoA synthetase